MTKISLFTLLSTLIFITGCFQDLVPTQKSVTSTTDDSGDISEVEPSEIIPTRTSEGAPLFNLNLMMAGQTSWVPGGPRYTVNGSDPVITISDARVLFSTDSRLKIRFKVLEQPNTIQNNNEYCYGRESGTADAYKYTKLKFDIRLRNIVQNTFSILGRGQYTDTTLDNHYYTQTIGPISVNQLSKVIDLSNSRDATSFGTVIEVANVRSDSNCQYHTERNETDRAQHSCPSEDLVREQSCWHMQMEISNDHTRDF